MHQSADHQVCKTLTFTCDTFKLLGRHALIAPHQRSVGRLRHTTGYHFTDGLALIFGNRFTVRNTWCSNRSRAVHVSSEHTVLIDQGGHLCKLSSRACSVVVVTGKYGQARNEYARRLNQSRRSRRQIPEIGCLVCNPSNRLTQRAMIARQRHVNTLLSFLHKWGQLFTFVNWITCSRQRKAKLRRVLQTCQLNGLLRSSSCNIALQVCAKTSSTLTMSKLPAEWLLRHCGQIDLVDCVLQTFFSRGRAQVFGVNCFKNFLKHLTWVLWCGA